MFERKKIYLIYYFIFFLLVSIIVFVSINKNYYNRIKSDTIDYLASLNLGFSGRINLVDNGAICIDCSNDSYSQYKNYINENIFKIIPKIIKYKISDLYETKFEKMYIDINFKNLDKLLKNKKNIILTKNFSKKVKVDSKIKFNNKIYDARISLKGLSLGHYNKNIRYSLKVELKDNKSIFGFNKFSIVHPLERQYPYNDYYSKIFKKINNLYFDNKYLDIYLNGQKWGAMHIQENISEHYAELNMKKSSIFLKFGLDPPDPYQIHENYLFGDQSIYLDFYENKVISKNTIFRRYISYITKLYLNKNNFLFDQENLFEVFLLSLFWGNFHDATFENAKFYFNPYTLKLEFITNDQARFRELNNIKDISNINRVPWYHIDFIKNGYYKINNKEENKLIIKKVIESFEDFKVVDSYFPVDRSKKIELLKENMTYVNLNFNEILKYIKQENTKKRFIDLKISEDRINNFKNFINFYHFDNGKILIYNLLPYTITITQISNDVKSENISIKIPSHLKNKEPYIYYSNFKGIQDNNLNITATYKNYSKITENKLTLYDENIINPLKNNNNSNFLIKSGDKFIFKKGILKIEEPIYINGDLILHDDNQFLFSNNSYLIINGCVISNNKKIINFDAIQDYWLGLYILNCKKEISLNNINFNNIKELDYGVLNLSGGINIYNSKVSIENIIINNAKGEDAINIIDSSYYINNIEINNAKSDGIDLDFSNGELINSIFIDIGGDAIDLSGSNTNISKTYINNVKDKAISIGERSIININGARIMNTEIGIAIKDESELFGNNIEIQNSRFSDVITFIKKNYYGPASAHFKNFKSDKNKFINQIANTLFVNDIKIKETDFNKDEIY